VLYDLNQEGVAQTLAGKHFDVCIAGAGVAGVTVALKLAAAGKSILLLEGGGKEPAPESQDLYKGENVGMEYLDIQTCRLRFLGGTSNHWGGWCRPLDAFDFEAKAHIPYSGWPIRKADIVSYENEAYDILDISRRPGVDREFSPSEGALSWFDFAHSPPTRFRTKYSDTLSRSSSIHLVLNANVVDFRLDDAGRRVLGAICRDQFNLTVDHNFQASHCVLSMGGIENARALLNANSRSPNGIGNENDLVGRFFSDHPHFELGIYWQRTSAAPRRFLSPTPALQQRAKIANCGLQLIDPHGGGSPLKSAKRFVRQLACEYDLVQAFFQSVEKEINCVGQVFGAWEQTPNYNSRVKLSDSRDRLGLRTVSLDWQWTPMERHTAKVCALELGKAFARGDIGRVKINDWVLDDALPLPTLESGERVAGSHHMGTTRMSDDARTGVVDQNCRVFGLDNFYIAGSSVFPTFGHANPTFTIVQLALRLADHIKRLG